MATPLHLEFERDIVELQNQIDGLLKTAEEKGIENASRVRVWSKRGSVVGTAIVTKRIKPLRVNGRTVWTVGIPVHWGFVGLTEGSMANQLTPFVGDANTRCPEFKSFLVNIERAV